MSVAGCVVVVGAGFRADRTERGARVIFEGWCPDCDMQSVVVDAGDGPDAAENAWATCTECAMGWTWRDDAPAAPGESADRLRGVDAAAGALAA
jgi:hypothetical protein